MKGRVLRQWRYGGEATDRDRAMPTPAGQTQLGVNTEDLSLQYRSPFLVREVALRFIDSRDISVESSCGKKCTNNLPLFVMPPPLGLRFDINQTFPVACGGLRLGSRRGSIDQDFLLLIPTGEERNEVTEDRQKIKGGAHSTAERGSDAERSDAQ